MSGGKYRKDHNCLNCGFHVEEHYCSRCGQPNLELHENLWQFISHSVAHYFHFDNKFFQTLVPLLTKPGKVTLDYLAGKRARYINPISMYIFVSIVYFLVVYSGHKPSKDSVKTKTEKVNAINDQKAEMDTLDQELKSAGLNEQAEIIKSKVKLQESIDREIFKSVPIKSQGNILNALKMQYKAKKSDSLANVIEKLEAIYISNSDSTYSAYLARQNTLPASEKDNMFDRFMAKRRIGIGQNAEVIQEQLDHNKPKQYFLFMPLMALFIMLNFRKNHIKYLDHLIFTIHGMTAFFIVSIIIQPLNRLLFENSSCSFILELVLIGWIFWYLFNSLKVFYQRRNGVIIGRMIWIVILYGLSLKLSEMVIINIIYYAAM